MPDSHDRSLSHFDYDGQTHTDRRRRNLSELVQRAAYQAMMTPTRCKNAGMDESADVRIILTAVLQ